MDDYEQTYCVCNILHSESEFVAVDVLNDIPCMFIKGRFARTRDCLYLKYEINIPGTVFIRIKIFLKISLFFSGQLKLIVCSCKILLYVTCR
jgi:hypothetical protein